MTTRELLQMALEALEECADGVYFRYQAKETITAIRAHLAKPEPEPVAWMFQHDETGRTTCIDSWQVENGFEQLNPRLEKVCPLFTKDQL